MKKNLLQSAAICIMLIALTTNLNAQWTHSGTATYLTSNGDKVGIGTTTPANKLDIKTGSNCNLRVMSTATGSVSLILSRPTDALNCLVNYKTGSTDKWFTGCNGNNDFRIINGSQVAHLSINQATGNVGIGDTAATNKLSVAGSANFTGNVGIGTVTPSYSLDVQAASAHMQLKSTAGLSEFLIDKSAQFYSSYIKYRTGGVDKWAVGCKSFDNFSINNMLSGVAVGVITINSTTNNVGINYGSTASIPNSLSVNGNGDFTGNVGIGTSVASNKLSVVGSSDFSGNVGIGTTVANNKLSVVGSADFSGNVGIGTITAAYRLDVCGTIRAKEIRVETGWCDYVFADDYKLPTLSDVEVYIKDNKHLPDVIAGSEIECGGLEVGKVSAQMIKKIEELTLYAIEQEKAIANLTTQNARLEAKMNLIVDKGGK